MKKSGTILNGFHDCGRVVSVKKQHFPTLALLFVKLTFPIIIFVLLRKADFINTFFVIKLRKLKRF